MTRKKPLEAKVGATSECEVVDAKEPKPGIPNLRVTKVNGDRVTYDVASLRDR